jgi:hypothetical protein
MEKDTTNKTCYNTGLAKVAVQCSADTFVVNQSLVLRINICGENRHLRQARNRYRKPLEFTLRVWGKSIKFLNFASIKVHGGQRTERICTKT